jgi:hypothetical protein
VLQGKLSDAHLRRISIGMKTMKEGQNDWVKVLIMGIERGPVLSWGRSSEAGIYRKVALSTSFYPVEWSGTSLPIEIDTQIAEHCLTRTSIDVRPTVEANVTYSIRCILHMRQVHSIHIKKEIASMSNHL